MNFRVCETRHRGRSLWSLRRHTGHAQLFRSRSGSGCDSSGPEALVMSGHSLPAHKIPIGAHQTRSRQGFFQDPAPATSKDRNRVCKTERLAAHGITKRPLCRYLHAGNLNRGPIRQPDPVHGTCLSWQDLTFGLSTGPHRHPRNRRNTFGSTQEAERRPPQSAPGMPGLATSCPAR